MSLTMISENKFIKYEVIAWVSSFLIRQILATFVYSPNAMPLYELSKDVLHLLNKIVVAKLILTSHQGKELAETGPTNRSKDSEVREE